MSYIQTQTESGNQLVMLVVWESTSFMSMLAECCYIG